MSGGIAASGLISVTAPTIAVIDTDDAELDKFDSISELRINFAPELISSLCQYVDHSTSRDRTDRGPHGTRTIQ